MSRNKRFLSRFDYHVFYVLYPFVAYLLTLGPIYAVENNLHTSIRGYILHLTSSVAHLFVSFWLLASMFL
jgi:hypothetical protein